MLRSMYSGVSGLRNHQIRLDVIGNNIANVNTIGFKSSRVTFKDVLSQTLRAATRSQSGRGGMNPVQVGLGMSIASIDTNHTQGSMQSTGKTTDLGIEGNGFFVLRSGTRTVFSRAGNFDLDENGYLVVPGTGMKVQGWVNGQLADIVVSNAATFAAEPSRNVYFANNLDSLTVTGKSFRTTVDVYDSLGALHTVELEFTKTDVNQWTWTMVNPAMPPSQPQPTGVMVFDSNGKLETISNSTIEFKPLAKDAVSWSGLAPATFDDGSGGYLANLTWPATYPDKDGGANHTVNVQFKRIESGPGYTWNATIDNVTYQGSYNASTGVHDGDILYDIYSSASPLSVSLHLDEVTSTAGETTLAAAGRDGAPIGSLKSYSIDSSGNLIGEFSNGMLRSIGQIALAKFANPSGLQKAGDTTFTESNNSGMPQIGRAGTVGFGDISPGSLEMSNVDLSQEFTDMIVTQRGLQANSRIITTSDEVLQEVVNLKR